MYAHMLCLRESTVPPGGAGPEPGAPRDRVSIPVSDDSRIKMFWWSEPENVATIADPEIKLGKSADRKAIRPDRYDAQPYISWERSG